MTRADVIRRLHRLVHLLRATHPALLMPALLLMTAMGALAVALLIVTAVAALVVALAGAFIWPMLSGLNLLLGATVAYAPRTEVAS